MNAMQRRTLALALAGALSMPGALMAADATETMAAGQPGAYMPPSPDAMRVMRERMLEIRQTEDPQRRKALIEAQLKDMDAVMGDRPCAMVDDQGDMVVVGGRGMIGTSMPMADRRKMLERRMDMLEKRMDDMMQMMMQRPAR